MKNAKLHYLLEQAGLNTEKLATHPLVMSKRTHISQVLNNEPGRGKHTRKRVAAALKKEVSNPELLKKIFEQLSWNETGEIVPRETSQLEQKPIFTITLTGKCKGCGIKIHPSCEFCGECICEEDSL